MTDEELSARFNAVLNAAQAAYGEGLKTNHRISAVEKQQAVEETKLALRVESTAAEMARLERQHDVLMGRIWALVAGLILVAAGSLFAMLKP